MSFQKVYRIERFGSGGASTATRLTAQTPVAGAALMSEAERAALRAALQAGTGLRRAASELQAVIADTERAANAILAGTEEIDTAVDRLRMIRRKAPHDADALDDIAERTVEIYQACDFQDLTGQRIQNVIDVLADLEARLATLQYAMDGTPPVAHDAPLRKTGGSLENGPRLPADAGHLTQADVDRLFADPPHPAR